ncbi:hypothetical protein M422DRAFT_261829 [Sphaerobolus stellatus SS14]|uniref:Unplaced genomic scaffold SPHSTscaffold_109, whole genome shotgun sequence n=1 Tax=Sphaerobolus stellatus (strain SS14) TaxID=990650 RepID=A0A0C9VEA3_SPHS4|nr:hypothetical protein M422DRAFT_261829 [Sphaerobolus stellatus SS14]
MAQTTTQSLLVELPRTIFHFILDVNQSSNKLTLPCDLTQLRSKAVTDFPSTEISPMVLAEVDPEQKKILMDNLRVWSTVVMHLEERVPHIALRVRIAKAKGLPLDVRINSGWRRGADYTYGELIAYLITEYSARIRTLHVSSLKCSRGIGKLHITFVGKITDSEDGFSIQAPLLRKFQCIGGLGYDYVSKFSKDTQSSLRILNVLHDLHSSISLRPLLDCRDLCYLSYAHPTSGPGETSISFVAQGADQLQSVKILEYYYRDELIGPSLLPNPGNNDEGQPLRDSLCAPTRSFVLPSLRTLELKDIIIDKATIVCALAPPEGIQVTLPVFREVIFHKSAIIHPRLDHYDESEEDWDLPAPESATVYVVPNNRVELERYTALANLSARIGTEKCFMSNRRRRMMEGDPKGADVLAFVAINNPLAMSTYGRISGAKDDIFFLSAPNAEFASKLGLELDLSSIGLGLRTGRFGIIINDLNVSWP